MPTNQPTLEPLTVVVSEACRIMGIGRTRLYSLIKDGRLDIVKIGRRTLIRYDSLKRLADEGWNPLPAHR